MTTSIFDPGPLRIADDTHLVRLALRGPGSELIVHCNSMVVTGPEPMIVDLGPRIAEQQWLDQVGSIVDLADVRWVFLSHDDADHVGNIDAVAALCPDATFVTTWLATERMTPAMSLPLRRQWWVGDGESFTANGRRFTAVRPPVFDAPSTRALLDHETGVLWASDAFGTRVRTIVDHVGDLDAAEWAEGSLCFASWLSPWHELVAPDRWTAHLERFREHSPSNILSAHGPWIHGSHVDAAIGLLAGLPNRRAVPLPDQHHLDALLAASV